MGRLSDALLTGDLFDAPTARRTDPATSHEAAARMTGRAGSDRRAVLLAHTSKPDGLTDYELAALLDRQQNSAGKRRGELRDAGFIAETPMRRAAPSGSPAIVWRITPQGLAFAKLCK